jgi:hypothetical protein
MNRYDAGAIHSRGQEFPLTVDDSGVFRTNIGAETIRGTTREEVATAVNKRTREAQATVEVPYCQLEGGRGAPYKVTYWVATGIHGGSRNVIVRPGVPGDTGKAEQRRDHMHGVTLAPLTEGEAAELVALAQARDDAARQYSAFFDRHCISDLPRRVRDEIAARTS